jgi:hypothetical protein
LAFAVDRVFQFIHRPTKLHWQAVKRILQYVKHTITHGLLLQKTHSTSLQDFSDADWASCPNGRRSTGAYCVFLGSDLISWCSRKQPTVSQSSTEEEYKSVANTAAKLLWIQSLLRDLGLKLSSPPKLWCDNICATYLSVNFVFDFHFIWELVAAKSLEILFIPSSNQLADVLTKPLVSKRFHLIYFKLNVPSPPLNLREGINAQQIYGMSNLLKSPSESLDRAFD